MSRGRVPDHSGHCLGSETRRLSGSAGACVCSPEWGIFGQDQPLGSWKIRRREFVCLALSAFLFPFVCSLSLLCASGLHHLTPVEATQKAISQTLEYGVTSGLEVSGDSEI